MLKRHDDGSDLFTLGKDYKADLEVEQHKLKKELATINEENGTEY